MFEYFLLLTNIINANEFLYVRLPRLTYIIDYDYILHSAHVILLAQQYRALPFIQEKLDPNRGQN